MLKVYVSHACEEQDEGRTSWTLRIDARLESFGRQGRSVTRPFSHFIKSIVVVLNDAAPSNMDVVEDNGGSSRLEETTLEWTKGPATAETDGFEIKRVGNRDVAVKIVLKLEYQPEKYRPSPELKEIVDLELATRPQIVLAIWQYIKLHRLQESDEKKIVNCDEQLQRLFGVERMSFSEIPARLDPHLLPPLPIELDYLITVNKPLSSSTNNTTLPCHPFIANPNVLGSPNSSGSNNANNNGSGSGTGSINGSNPACWDIEVEVDDPSKSRPASANVVAQQREIALLEQKIAEVTTALKASTHHQRTLLSFASDPVRCVQRLMKAQCAEQQCALGEPAITLNDLNSAQTFNTDEIERTVSIFSNERLARFK